MNWKDHLPQGLVDAVWEPDAPAAKPQAAIAKATSVPSIPVASYRSTLPEPDPSCGPPSLSTQSSAVASIFAELKNNTDFDTTPVGLQLKETKEALAETGLSDEQMSKTAMKLTHQSPAKIVSVLQGLQAVLVADKQHFEATMQTAVTAEVSARKSKSEQLALAIQDEETKLASMRQEKQQVDKELQEKQDKITNARANYNAASEARNAELTQMISHYQLIPEVK